MEVKKHEGYIIINQIKVGDCEIVIGVHEQHPNMYATWERDNGQEYFWAHYFTDELLAKEDFCKRGLNQVKFYEQKRGKENAGRKKRH